MFVAARARRKRGCHPVMECIAGPPSRVGVGVEEQWHLAGPGVGPPTGSPRRAAVPHGRRPTAEAAEEGGLGSHGEQG